jgi:hypothetical protein
VPRFGGAFHFCQCASVRLQQDVNHVNAALLAQFKLHLNSLRPSPGDEFAGRRLAVLPPVVVEAEVVLAAVVGNPLIEYALGD